MYRMWNESHAGKQSHLKNAHIAVYLHTHARQLTEVHNEPIYWEAYTNI